MMKSRLSSPGTTDQPGFDFSLQNSRLAVLSFLKDTRGARTWTIRDLMGTLNIGQYDADKILAILQFHGYVSRADTGEWLTTVTGESVSGSKRPRFRCPNVQGAVSALFDRIAAINRESRSEFRVTEAVAFGDFLLQKANCQAADVGIELTRLRKSLGKGNANEFLQHLGGKNAFLNIQPYEAWMSERSHRRLVQSNRLQQDRIMML